MTMPLVTAAELHALLASGSPVTVLDVRWALGRDDHHDAYLAGHLPGAVFCDLETVLAAPVAPDGSGGRHPLPGTDRLQSDLRALGVRDAVPVVLYDAAGGLGPARGWWMLTAGGKTDARVLDGGLAAWAAAGLPLETGEVRPEEPGDVTLRPGARRLLTAADIVPFQEAGGVVVDGRPADRFRGENDTVDARAGHIPGAVSVPALANLSAEGTFRPAAELRAAFAAAGVDGSRDVALYCGSGVQASHLALAMEAAGIGERPPAVYIGSWSDWVSDPERPAETGPAR